MGRGTGTVAVYATVCNCYWHETRISEPLQYLYRRHKWPSSISCIKVLPLQFRLKIITVILNHWIKLEDILAWKLPELLITFNHLKLEDGWNIYIADKRINVRFDLLITSLRSMAPLANRPLTYVGAMKMGRNIS